MKAPKRSGHPRSEAVIIKPAEGMSYAFQEAIGVSGTVRHLIPWIEVEITNLDPSIEGQEVEEAVWEYC